MQFSSLHNHDEKSLLDSTAKVDEMFKRAEELNYKALAITNHGNVHSLIDFYKRGKKSTVKPILGIEFYECDDMKDKENSERFHLIALAKNNDGLNAIYNLSTLSYKDGYYYKPRIDIKALEPHANNLIILSACMAGRLSRLLQQGKLREAMEWAKEYKAVFPNYYIEIQAHDTEEQHRLNKQLIKIAKALNIPWVITLDTHMIYKEDMEVHSIFVQIGEGREVGESYTGCYLQSVEEVFQSLKASVSKEDISTGIETNNLIADMCNISIEALDNEDYPNQMPHVDKLIPKNFKSVDEYYKHLITQGWKKRGINKLSPEEKAKRKARIHQEYEVLKYLDYIDYFVMLYLLTNEAKKRGIPLGKSRGSGGNSYSLYLLGVTEVDSIRWGLDFSRFASKGRKSMPDYDMDISKRRRKEMIEISKELFGEEYVAPLPTFNTLSTKVAIRDIGRILDERGIYEIPYILRDEVAKMIPTIITGEDEEENEVALKEAIKDNNKLQQYHKKFPLWFKYVMKLEGLPKSLGCHASGVLITRKPILSYGAMCFNSDKELMFQFDMNNSQDDLKLPKMDYLGLATLDIVDDTLRLANLTWEDINVDTLDLNDPNVYKNIYAKGLTVGIFQMESYTAQDLLRDMECDNINDIFGVNAMNRPAILSVGMHYTYIKNKKNPKGTSYIHNDLKDVTDDSYGVMLYQEHALQIFRLAGFPDEEVDLARRAIGKKKEEVIIPLREKLQVGLETRKWTKDQIEEIWKLLVAQSSYSFNKGHSSAYGLLSYVTAWLKYYYPVQFMTALLTNAEGKYEKISKYINECQRMGIKVLPPSINYSERNFTVRDNSILFGLLMVKNVGEGSVEIILENRPYAGFVDLLAKCHLDTTTIVSLVKAGCFTEYKCDKIELLEYYAKSKYEPLKYKDVITIDKKAKDLLYEKGYIKQNEYSDKDYCLMQYNKYRRKLHKEKDAKRLSKELNEFREKNMIGNEADWEMEVLSMYLTTDPFKEIKPRLKPFNNLNENITSVIAGTIIDIKMKTDSKKQKYCYIDLLNYEGNIIECICWASAYTKYQNSIKKGKKLVIQGKKQGSKFIFQHVKLYNEWIEVS